MGETAAGVSDTSNPAEMSDTATDVSGTCKPSKMGLFQKERSLTGGVRAHAQAQ